MTPTPESVTLIRLEQTCWACPSQWDAWDSEGGYYYIRFRWGFLSVSKGSSDTWDDHEEVYGRQISDDLDGVLTTEEMLAKTGMTLSPSDSLRPGE